MTFSQGLQRIKNRMKCSKIFTLTSAIFLVALIAFFRVGHRKHDLVSLLKANPAILLASIQIKANSDGNPPVVFINEPETLKYITSILRRTNEEPKLGVRYEATLTFNNGEKCQIMLYIPKGGRALSIGVEKGWLEDLDHYGVDLVDPVPKGLVDALIKLTSFEYMQPSQSDKK